MNKKEQPFSSGEKIIWDSHFGYDVGTFVGDGVMDGTWKINIKSGLYPGENSLPKSEIHPYSEELVQELTEKYKYKKSF